MVHLAMLPSNSPSFIVDTSWIQASRDREIKRQWGVLLHINWPITGFNLLRSKSEYGSSLCHSQVSEPDYPGAMCHVDYSIPVSWDEFTSKILAQVTQRKSWITTAASSKNPKGNRKKHSKMLDPDWSVERRHLLSWSLWGEEYNEPKEGFKTSA